MIRGCLRWIHQNPYKVLGVTRESNHQEIRSAYLNLARKFHPDVSPGQEVIKTKENFKKINEAYHILKSKQLSPSSPSPSASSPQDSPDYEVTDMLWSRSQKDFPSPEPEPVPVPPPGNPSSPLAETLSIIVLMGFLTAIIIFSIRSSKAKALKKLELESSAISSSNPANPASNPNSSQSPKLEAGFDSGSNSNLPKPS